MKVYAFIALEIEVFNFLKE